MLTPEEIAELDDATRRAAEFYNPSLINPRMVFAYTLAAFALLGLTQPPLAESPQRGPHIPNISQPSVATIDTRP